MGCMIVNVRIGEQENASDTVVLIDVIRSSTTISVALDMGAKSVIPFKSSDEARKARRKWSKREDVLLVGEEFGQKPEGFDMGISPRKMTRDKVKDKVIIYRSNNLTRVLKTCEEAERVIIGGLANSKTVADFLDGLNPEIVNIIACGVRKKDSRLLNEEYGAPCDPYSEANIEDIIGAGAIVHQIDQKTTTDFAKISLLAYENADWKNKIKRACTLYAPYAADKSELEWLREDIEFCLTENRNSIVPILKGGAIRSHRDLVEILQD